MAESSKIEWTDRTWNPVVGCSVVSPGCTNCYAMRMAARLEAMAGPGFDDNGYAVRGTNPLDHYRGTTRPSRAGPVWTGRLAFAPDRVLTAPLRRRKPTMWFVNSMGDLFHESVPDEWIDRVFAVMALSPQHTFQVLTKRAARMRGYFEGRRANFGRASDVLHGLSHGLSEEAHQLAADRLDYFDSAGIAQRNLWLGVSAEDQARADERIPELLSLPAAVRFVSAEPLLGPLEWLPSWDRLDWVIVGGESGPGARPMHPDWARSLRDQCARAGVPYFFKQFGEWAPVPARDDLPGRPQMVRAGDIYIERNGRSAAVRPDLSCALEDRPVEVMRRLGKARAGRLLDGREHNDMPEALR